MATAAPPAPTGLLTELMEMPERTTISVARPTLGWIFHSPTAGAPQAGYQVLVASTKALAEAFRGDLWDTGRVGSAQSINIVYAGKALAPSHSYYWRVRVWGASDQPSPWSEIQQVRTAAELSPEYTSTARYPLLWTDVSPGRVASLEPGRYFFDFRQDAFGYITLHLNGSFGGRTIEVRFGERDNGDAVSTSPGGRIRYAMTKFPLADGDITYRIHPPDISGKGVSLPQDVGTVLPFRFVEILDSPVPLTARSVRQRRLHYPFNPDAATFRSSSGILNRVWELCHYSMQATSFAGVYVDGDRERLPYEADAYINQLSHYAVDREFTIARHSHEYLLDHPTWPTEWKFHSIFLAWADYLHTGDARSLEVNYGKLKARLFLERERPSDGLLRGFAAYPPRGGLSSDIVDWPPPERDGYVFREYNTVVNAFYLRSLELMARIADVVRQPADATRFRLRYARALVAFNRVFWDAGAGRYVDGESTTHVSAHANFFPLAFGLVPDERRRAVTEYVVSRGMAPSVYGAQYLLEGLFEAGAADAAVALLTSAGERSWWNMIFDGSTITTEAWSLADKPNIDWNHAWGAAAGNLIARYVLGLKPLEPGFGKVEIRPQLGSLQWAEGTIPTIRGPVSIRVEGSKIDVELPGNMTARIVPPK
ncbi:MAG: hypothetical protein IT160_17385 [Bryobacterales bacterium]|nr:hypothetical protein [Bryobacterales bacterium]